MTHKNIQQARYANNHEVLRSLMDDHDGEGLVYAHARAEILLHDINVVSRDPEHSFESVDDVVEFKEGLEAVVADISNAKSNELNEDTAVVLAKIHIMLGDVEKALDNLSVISTVSESKNTDAFVTTFMLRRTSIDRNNEHDIGNFALLNDAAVQATLVVKAIFEGSLLKAELLALNEEEDEAIGILELLIADGQKTFGNFKIDVDPVFLNLVERAYILLAEIQFKTGNVIASVESYRRCLSLDFELSSLGYREVLSSLGNLLLRHVSETEYLPPSVVGGKSSSSSSSSSTDVYVPNCALAEALLLFRLHDAHLRNSDVQSSELEHVQLYDGLSLAYCSLVDSSSMLCNTFEAALRQNYKDRSLWLQYALSLINDRQWERANVVIGEAVTLLPNNAAVRLVAARLALSDHINEPQKSIDAAQAGIKLGGPLVPQLQHVLGAAYAHKSKTMKVHEERLRTIKMSLEAFHLAEKKLKTDYKLLYDIALAYANLRDIPKALRYVHRSMNLNKSFASSWELMVLLITSKKEYTDAMAVLNAAMEAMPQHLPFYLIKGRLLQVIEGDARDSIVTYNKGLVQFKEMYGMETQEVEGVPTLHMPDDGEIAPGQTLANLCDPESGELLVTSSNRRLKRLLQSFWLASTEAFVSLGLFEDAQVCLEEAVVMDDDNPSLFYHMAMMELAQGDEKHASSSLNKALAVDMNHAPSLVQLAALLIQQVQRKEEEARMAIQTEQLSEIDKFVREVIDNENNNDLSAWNEANDGPLSNTLEDPNEDQDDGTMFDGVSSVASDRSSAGSVGKADSNQQPVDNRLVVAASHLKSALLIAPMDPVAWHQMGLVKKLFGEAQEASDAFFTALQLEETNPLLEFELPGTF